MISPPRHYNPLPMFGLRATLIVWVRVPVLHHDRETVIDTPDVSGWRLRGNDLREAAG
jgi:hypothetical protein